MVDLVTLPSVVQTVEYAETVLSIYYAQVGIEVGPTDLRRAAAVRAERGRNLEDPGKRYRLVVAASALRAISVPAVAAPALERLEVAAGLAEVIVVPDGAALIAHGFGVFDGEVVIEPVAGPEIVHPAGSPLANQYLDVADRLISAGLDRGASLEAVRSARSAIES